MTGWEHRQPSEIQMGNGTMLATFDASGELEQIFAPNIDALQSRLGSFRTSVLIPSSHEGGVPEVLQISPDLFHIRLLLETGSQVLRGEYHHKTRPLRLHRRIG